MFENNWKTWVIVLIAFFGAGIELLKHLPGGRESVVWDKETLQYVDNRPYSLRHQVPKKLKLAPPARPVTHVAGDQKVLAEALKSYTAATAPQTTEVEHKVEPVKGKVDEKKKKKINEDDYEEVIDPVTGKKVKRKKKKEAKKEDKPKIVTASEPVKPTQPDQDEDSDAAAIARAIAESADTGELPLPIKNKNVEPFLSLQDWERILLTRPNLSETKVFIQAFQNHTVTSEVYYKIAKLMLADIRPEMKSLGVLVAGSNQSVLSFQILAGVANNGTGDPKANAAKYLTAYSSSLKGVQVLLGVLRGSDNVASIAALRQFDVAANRFLAASTTSTGGTVGTRANANAFQPFVAVLTTLSRSTDGSIAAQAAASLNRLSALLGTSGNPTGNIAQTP